MIETTFMPATRITVTCDCGTVHQIDRNLIGSKEYWVCIPCLDRKHREFCKKTGYKFPMKQFNKKEKA